VNASETIQGRTPLLWAAVSGRTDLVKLLLDHGADVNVRESLGGTTVLICATASERGDLALVNLLLEKGAALDATDGHGDSALDWARRRGSRQIVQVLERKGARSRAASAPPLAHRPMGDANTAAKAVEAALPLLQQTSETFFAKSGQGCVSCHHQSLTALTLQVARERGFPVDKKKAKQQAETTQRLLASRRERLLQGMGVADQLPPAWRGTRRPMRSSIISRSSKQRPAIGEPPCLGPRPMTATSRPRRSPCAASNSSAHRGGARKSPGELARHGIGSGRRPRERRKPERFTFLA
jgi:hypothetical protein